MDLNNLRGNTWNANAASPNPPFEQRKSEVSKFEESMTDPRYNDGKLREVIDITREPHQRAIMDSPLAAKKQMHMLSFSENDGMIDSSSISSSPTKYNALLDSPGNRSSTTLGDSPSPTRSVKTKMVKKLEAASLLNTIEKPASRKQISDLENHLLQQVRDLMEDIGDKDDSELQLSSPSSVMSSPLVVQSIDSPLSSGSPQSLQDGSRLAGVPKKFFPPSPKQSKSTSPLKKMKDVKFILNRNKIMEEFRVTSEELIKKTWLDRLIVSENLFLVNDDVASRFCDMMSVQTAELGGLMRKLRRTYKQNFQQLRTSWDELYQVYESTYQALNASEEDNRFLQLKLETQEEDISARLESELEERRLEIESEKLDNNEKLQATELELEKTMDTLSTLNAIFKSMQQDSQITNAGDFKAKHDRLEREVMRLREENIAVDKTNRLLEEANNNNDDLKRQIKHLEHDIQNLRLQVNKRDNTIATLMERDSLRAAEIEKLQSIADAMNEANENKDLDFQEPPSTFLCIKCKKALDDLTNIREAVMGPGAKTVHIICKTYRLLLPNIKGRRPLRTNDWVRLCMRSILMTKMREDVALHGIKGSISRFPEFAFSWFEPTASNPTPDMAKQADEDRWGFYYGVKVLSKDDPESNLFFMLLDESMGEDGTAFVLYCMSVALSLGGQELWEQFTPAITHGASADDLPDKTDKTPPVIWMPLKVAKDTVKAVFVKALEAQLIEALENVEALKQVPKVADVVNHKFDDKDEMEIKNEIDEATVLKMRTEKEAKEAQEARSDEATHINFYTWLRMMASRYQVEKMQRNAAIRLMFETSAIGALTPSVGGGPDIEGIQQHVEFPQFQSILQTLIPTIELTEIAGIYARCYDEGNKYVTAAVFIKVANEITLFSRALNLPPLPLLIRPKGKKKQVDDTPLSKTEEEFWRRREEYTGPPEDELLKREKKLRVDLGAVVHRKMSQVEPELRELMKRIPERWRLIIEDAIRNVHISLQDAYMLTRSQQTKPKSTGINDADEYRVSGNIDGIQPYIFYQRLLSLSLTIRSMSESPIMPGEIFKATRYDLSPCANIDKQRAIRLLGSLEDALMITSEPKNKYYRVNLALQGLLSQKIKNWYKKCTGKDGVYIPLPVRLCIRRGYLRGKGKLRFRRCIEDPWYAQSTIAQIYYYKTVYDKKAILVGSNPISLSEATVACHLTHWGNADVSDRFLHDFFHCIKLYELAIPRLRLFMCFLGVGSNRLELSNDVKWLLNTEKALSIYLNLIAAIQTVKFDDAALPEYLQSKHTMFPSSETKAGQQRDFWYEQKEVVRSAVLVWIKSLKGISANEFTVFLDKAIVEDNHNFDKSYVDVDDYLWLVMNHWAESMEACLRTAEDKLNYLTRQDKESHELHAVEGHLVKNTCRSNSLKKFVDVIEAIYAKKNNDIITPANITVDVAYGCQLCSKSDISNSNHNTYIRDIIRSWMLWDMTSDDPESVSRLNSTIKFAQSPSLSVAVARKGWDALKDLVSMQINERQYDDNKEQHRRLELMRQIKLRLDEIFLHLPEPAKNFDDSKFVYLPNFTHEQEQEIWQAMQSIFNIYGQYLENDSSFISTKGIPADEWSRGNRIPMEPSKIFDLKKMKENK